MKKTIVDSSVLLAVLNEELGYEHLERLNERAVFSSVNVCEIVGVLHRKGLSMPEIEEIIGSLVTTVIPFDLEIAFKAGELIKKTADLGLSLGDRVCLATAIIYDFEVLTADKVWNKLKIPGLKIHLIR